MASALPSASSATTSSAPLSVEKISKKAQEYEFNRLIPLRNWLRSSAALFKEAQIYEREGNDEQAYLLFFRQAELVLVKLATHPEARDGANRKALMEAEELVKTSLEKLEVLKPRINKRYERYTKLVRERDSRRSSQLANQSSLPRAPTHADPALAGVAKPLEAGENRDLAVRLAKTEISRRATVRRAIRQAGISEEVERSRRTGGLWTDWENTSDSTGSGAGDDLSKRIQELRVNLDQGSHQHPTARPSAVSPSYKYPTVPQQKSVDTVPLPPVSISGGSVRLDPPNLPPKEQILSRDQFGFDGLPPRPSKFLEAPALPAKIEQNETSSPAELDPGHFTFKPSAYLENGTPLRTVFLPPDLRTRFLAIAAPNTRNNLETCGILCGTLISNALFISKLLIPEQTATSDTCETVNESAIFDYCDSEDLMVLGWIHTHPTQTCFMSSRDLHTHCGYQVMLPESIAIVCAPSKSPDWGVFRLTDPPGLKSVLNCTQTGLFHPHTEPNIYTDALRPGHVFEARGLEFETVDLRPGS
ncbi:hypothetical protein ASPZODRAFT_61901 [Penicilliopsis zonata CBS 506.65]|uniref:MPN domain-containing protein n=1 Tax=Penicilliopsis zonata CBS 506.65 TaxID=1073090 RepID=A0A1L9SNF4_9EURO|nr:hypothetical protein ASPZODRAFT_61901 [Penicilliopsis zonata CBS 506.65]OJJ48641.1 hypothetical protein ASPZODRAFT_61901 [Penicilliopsis zonata CBS 506.65]